MDFSNKLAQVRAYLNSRFVQREELIDVCLTALVARQHVLLLGPPGTAKTQLISELAACLHGGQHFQWLLTRFTTPEELFGPVSLSALERDSYRRVTAGKLPEATTALLDEVFKANSAILNTLLSIINERVFYNDGQSVKVPLITLFGASNEVPVGEEEAALAAFADRFLIWYQVEYLEEDGAFAEMLRLDGGGARPAVGVDEIAVAAATAEQVEVGDDVIDAIVELRRRLRAEGITVSDRRWKQSLTAVKAKAFLNGSSRAEVQRDMPVLAHTLWTSPEHRDIVQRVVRATVDPYGQEVAELLAEAREVWENAINSGDTNIGVEAHGKLKNIAARIDELEKLNVDVRNPKERVQTYIRDVLAKCLKITL